MHVRSKTNNACNDYTTLLCLTLNQKWKPQHERWETSSTWPCRKCCVRTQANSPTSNVLYSMLLGTFEVIMHIQAMGNPCASNGKPHPCYLICVLTNISKEMKNQTVSSSMRNAFTLPSTLHKKTLCGTQWLSH